MELVIRVQILNEECKGDYFVKKKMFNLLFIAALVLIEHVLYFPYICENKKETAKSLIKNINEIDKSLPYLVAQECSEVIKVDWCREMKAKFTNQLIQIKINQNNIYLDILCIFLV